MHFPLTVLKLHTHFPILKEQLSIGFEPSLLSNLAPDWLDDYNKFISELQSNFGPHDPEGEAKAEIKNLQMCDNQRVTKYLVKFNHLAD